MKSIGFLILLTAVLCGAFVLSVCSGSYDTPVGELLKGIFGLSADPKINLVVQNNRLPRICTAILAGAGLGITGCVLQAILRNPLASASTLGVSQGASFGAAFAIMILNVSSGAAIPICAFAGSMAVALVILGLSRFRQVSAEGIVLAGVAISACFLLHRWDFNALLSGEETAISLGIHVRKLTMVNMILCCFCSSVIVANIGLINFIRDHRHCGAP